MLKFGCDYGDNCLKICASIIPNHVLMCDSISRHKYSSVKKLLLLAIAFLIPETVVNISTLFELCQLSNPEDFGIDTWIVGDLKFYNKSLGLQDYSSTYPCSFCTIVKFDLLNVSYDLRTFGMIRQNFQDFLDSGYDLKNAKSFNSVAS